MNHTLNISELFYSIQGESTYAGYPCVFIRLADCNLRCSYCDATYTYDEEPKVMDLDQILAFVNRYKVSLVQITGGEPLLQEGVYQLMHRLLEEKRIVLLETNGTISLTRVPAEVIKVMDVKCPSSSMADQFHFANLGMLNRHDEVKFVIGSADDYKWAKTFIETHIMGTDIPGEQQQRPTILFSPIQPGLSPTDLADWLLRDQLPVRMQLQLHTLLWPGEKRGV